MSRLGLLVVAALLVASAAYAQGVPRLQYGTGTPAVSTVVRVVSPLTGSCISTSNGPTCTVELPPSFDNCGDCASIFEEESQVGVTNITGDAVAGAELQGTGANAAAWVTPTPTATATPTVTATATPIANQFSWTFVDVNGLDLPGLDVSGLVPNKVEAKTLTQVCCYADAAGVTIAPRVIGPAGSPTPALPTPAACATPGWTGDAGCATAAQAYAVNAQLRHVSTAATGATRLSVVVRYSVP